ncbi:MAG: acyl-CoA dehydrogenase [Myxococcota bacterium]|jgi:acyl-CoA dehydrogenase
MNDASITTWDRARQDLRDFHARQPENAYTSDHQFQRLMARLMGATLYARFRPHFKQFGAVVAGPLDRAAIVNNRPGNEPKLDRWSPIGERIEAIAHHPTYEDCGRHIYEDGEVIAAYGDDAPHTRALGLFYLSSYVGEAGHNCPVACTVGAVKALNLAGSDELKAQYLPGLLTKDYTQRQDGAQFMTELQGGSDVGANAVVASADGDALGTTRWRIHGEKWFCSNADADLILMTARVGAEGTRGLGLFLVPRVLPHTGALNQFAIRRLKDKLGTRSMPSAEIDFNGAVAYAIGPVGDGFRTMMTSVINTSRVYNTVGCAGIARRAREIATAYAHTRRAFGQPIIDFPLVQEMVAEMRATSQAVTAGALTVAATLDRDDLGDAEKAWLRVGTNLVKMRSCQHSHRVILTAIETLGGNGAIETFSVLPRLLRDNVVYENWEGTHNTLIAQTVRDFARYGLHAGLLTVIRRHLQTGDAGIDAAVAPALATLSHIENALGPIVAQAGQDAGLAALQLRPHVERLADALFAGAFAQDVASEPDPTRRKAETEALAWFVRRHVGLAPVQIDADYAAQAKAIAAL